MKCPYCEIKFKPTAFNQKSCRGEECFPKEVVALMKKNNDKKWKAKKDEYKKVDRTTDLQKAVNQLARKIDEHFSFNCIDCNKPFNELIDAAHLHNSQGNENIRFNLHNLHSARRHCNFYNSEHKVGYRVGLEQRYGKEYLEMVENLGLKYPHIGLNHVEISEKLAIVRKLIRDFDTFILTDGSQARTMFNKIIGIYE